MCRHCDRITEHVEDTPIVHAFMELTARRIAEHEGESVSADDLDVRIERTRWIPNPFFGTDAHKRVLRMLNEMHR